MAAIRSMDSAATAADKPAAKSQSSSELTPSFVVDTASNDLPALQSRKPNCFEKYDEASRQIEESMRKAIDEGALPIFRETVSGAFVQLERAGWHQISFGVPGFEYAPHHLTSPGPDTRGQPMLLRKSDFQKWKLMQQDHVAAIATSSSSGRRGAPAKFDWPDAKDFAMKLLDKEGEFREWDSEWKTKADLERKVLGYMEKTVGIGNGPGESTLRAKVSEWLAEWQNRKHSPDASS
jgi:hypothetical protein